MYLRYRPESSYHDDGSCFNLTHPVRRKARQVVISSAFEWLVALIIACNCVFLSLYRVSVLAATFITYVSMKLKSFVHQPQCC